jgi:predicted secreted Zn-dependent protease
MRGLILASMVALAVSAPEAVASVKVTVKEQSYTISGRTGADLLAAMDRKGPRHGFLARAIAQTKYLVTWDLAWTESRKACRVSRADAQIAITYTYPKAGGDLSPEMRRRWARFLDGVRKHEETHGRLAAQMVRAAESSIVGLSIKNDPGCRKARKEVKRRVAEIYADYEDRQMRFDSREHGDAGNVEGLIRGLVRR